MLTPHDHQMIQLAKARGQVIVTTDDRRALVTLITWRPTRNGKRTNTARVQYPSGTYATIKPLDRITTPAPVLEVAS
jgi:hypothetical protein